MKQAVEIALLRGYEPFRTTPKEKWIRQSFLSHSFTVEIDTGGYAHKNYSDALLDPLFWQALVGWNNPEGSDAMWRVQWRKFIDHIGEGLDEDDFFNNLIK